MVCGIAKEQGKWRNGFGHNGTSANEGVGSDVVATHDGGVGPDGSPFPDVGPGIVSFAHDGAAGIDDVGEDTTWAKKNIVIAGHAFINGDVVLHLDVVA